MSRPILTPGDEIRVVAPSQSWTGKRYDIEYGRAKQRLESLGYTVSFGDNVKQVERFGTANRASRLADLQAAYRDTNVKLVMALTGGWSANELLPLIDWKIIRQNPKPFMGLSDNVVLLNAIYAQTGQRGLLGPNFSTFGRMTQWRYTLESFQSVMCGNTVTLKPSTRWGDQGVKTYRTNPWRVEKAGKAGGVLIGGNLGSLYLLQGTEYMPKFDEPFIFALEDDNEPGKNSPKEVKRRLESLLQQPGFRRNLKGMLVGRFQVGSKLSQSDLTYIMSEAGLNVVTVSGVDFGHTLPMLTLPIGLHISLEASDKVRIEIN